MNSFLPSMAITGTIITQTHKEQEMNLIRLITAILLLLSLIHI